MSNLSEPKEINLTEIYEFNENIGEWPKIP